MTSSSLPVDDLLPVGALSGGDLAAVGSGARERILATASALFYGVGIRAVGVDRIIAEAAVAKATFYHHFATKDALVCAYLTDQHQRQEGALAPALEGARDPGEVIVGIFEAVGEISCGAGFRGCPFVNAAVEYPDPRSPVREVVAGHRRWFSGVLRELLTTAGHPDPGSATLILVTLRDGIVVGGQLGSGGEVAMTLRSAVLALLGSAGAAAVTGAGICRPPD